MRKANATKRVATYVIKGIVLGGGELKVVNQSLMKFKRRILELTSRNRSVLYKANL